MLHEILKLCCWWPAVRIIKKKRFHAALEYLTSRKNSKKTQEVTETLLSGTCILCFIQNPEGWRAIFISLWVITFRHEDQNWKLFSVNFEQLLVDKCMNSGISGKKIWYESYRVTWDWKQKEMVFCFPRINHCGLPDKILWHWKRTQ